MSIKLPNGAIEVLDCVHDYEWDKATPEQCIRLSMHRHPQWDTAKHIEWAKNTYNNYKKQPNKNRPNLILLPSMLDAINLYEQHWTEMDLDSRRYVTNPKTMSDYILGNRCHVSDDLLNAIVALSHRVGEVVAQINPSLSATPRYNRTEVDDLWDAGLIAMGDDRPCFTARYDGNEPSKGKGDGAYRILINTDTCWGNSDGQGLATLLCLTNVLAHFNPVEIWVQQGWLSSSQDPRNRSSGITCFRVGAMGSINIRTLAFWLGSSLRDSPFSRNVNNALGRDYSGVSVAPAIPCDFYTNNGVTNKVPDCSAAILKPFTDQGKAQIQALARWVSAVSSDIIYPQSIEDSALQIQ